AWRLGGGSFALAAAAVALGVVVMLVLLGKRQGAGRWLRGGALLVLAGTAVVAVLVLPRTFETRAAGDAEGLLAAVPFSDTALAEARASNRPVFVWFTADWCLTCKVNESVAIEREATRAAFEKAGVVAMRGDWTRRAPEITRF